MANANSPQMGNGQQTLQHKFAPHYVRTELHGRVVLLPIVDKVINYFLIQSELLKYSC